MTTTLDIDLTMTPFSARGTWMSLAKPTKKESQPQGPGLYLRSHHSRGIAKRELFLLRALRNGVAVPFHEEIQAHKLTILPDEGEGSIEFVFDGDKSVRMRGRGLDLSVVTALSGGQTVGYSEGKNRFTVNARPSLRRYLFDMVYGNLTWDAPFEEDRSTRVDLTMSGDTWEVAIDEHISSWVEPQRRTFDQVLEDRSLDWSNFSGSFPSSQKGWDKGRTMASYVLWSCTMSPCGQLTRPSVFMSLNWMDQVWSWDNLFNAASLATGHAQLALDQILLLADHQDEHGAYPDGINDMFKHYNFSKPPVQGLLFSWMRKHSPTFWTEENQKALYPTLKSFTLWWLQFRRWEGEALCHYLHGNDSGWDNTTLLRKGSPIQCPDLNAFLIIQCRLLEEMASVVRDSSQDWKAMADELLNALLGTLWKDDQFCGRLLTTGELVDSQSLVSCMPVVLGPELPEEIRSKTISRIKTFITEHGPATEHPESPLYDPDGYWRGPIWAPSTFLIVQGLINSQKDDLAKEIARKFCHTCQNASMAENFDALTGDGLRDLSYTWTSAVFLELARLIEA